MFSIYVILVLLLDFVIKIVEIRGEKAVKVNGADAKPVTSEADKKRRLAFMMSNALLIFLLAVNLTGIVQEEGIERLFTIPHENIVLYSVLAVTMFVAEALAILGNLIQLRSLRELNPLARFLDQALEDFCKEVGATQPGPVVSTVREQSTITVLSELILRSATAILSIAMFITLLKNY